MQDNDRPLYSRKHVELLVKLAFIKGQEFAVANMLRDASQRVEFAVGEDYEYQESGRSKSDAVDQGEAGYPELTMLATAG